MIVDSTDIVSYKTNGLVKYSGKYHNYCTKLTIAVTEDLIPVSFSIDKGSRSDSKILDDILKKTKLPYELFLDKGYENYMRRRILKLHNCQVRMEMKKGKNKKRGPKFKFTEEHKKIRSSIEKVFGWMKSFSTMILSKAKKRALLIGQILFVLCFVTFARLDNLKKIMNMFLKLHSKFSFLTFLIIRTYVVSASFRYNYQ